MARNIRKRGRVAYLVMWVVFALITIGVAHLLVHPEDRNDKYCLAVGALIFAQGLIFAYSAATIGRFQSPAAKVLMETGALLGLYQAVVLILALAAGVMASASFEWLLVAHGICLLALCVMGAINLVALWRIHRSNG